MESTWKYVLLCFLLLTAPVPAQAHDAVWPGEKLSRMYPTAQSFEQRNLYVSAEQRQRIETLLQSPLPPEDLKPSLYLAVVKGAADQRPRREAVLLFIDAHGPHGRIETGIVVDRTGTLSGLFLFENHEPAALGSPAFLRQFTGKRMNEPFLVGKDITAPPAIAESAQAVAAGARRGLVIINELLRRR